MDVHVNQLKNISPIDGRYKRSCQEVSEYFSEYALIKYRIIVEIKWLLFLNDKEYFFPKVSEKSLSNITSIMELINDNDILRVKKIEEETNHDVKAVEYFIREKLESLKNEEITKVIPYVHYLCTSEDINNIAYGLCLYNCIYNIIIPNIQNIIDKLKEFSFNYSDVSLLSKTHGQPASPTTFGKEMSNYYYRLYKHINKLKNIEIYVKFNGAVGNFNAHKVCDPNIDWIDNIKYFIETYFNLHFSLYCTQIQDHDYICEISDTLARLNYTLIDLSVDMWLYISSNVLKLKVIQKEIGSSTMPHKVNPIDFENAEGNLHLANSLFKLFSSKLPISRLQRDLSDSTVLRNLGSSFAYSLISYKSLLRGLNKIDVDQNVMNEQLNQNWCTLAEPIQIIMKKYNIADSYEQLKNFTRGKSIDKQCMYQFIQQNCSHLPKNAIDELMNLTPHNYLGYASYLSKNVEHFSQEYIKKN
uniref:Adenylosuccinate lyase n=1 Tax=Plasmodium falciparum TaxID=5833 RepID=E1CDY9_PLAFA|nr:adenylosuccinate lyase [Plasmodium falciparum]